MCQTPPYWHHFQEGNLMFFRHLSYRKLENKQNWQIGWLNLCLLTQGICKKARWIGQAKKYNSSQVGGGEARSRSWPWRSRSRPSMTNNNGNWQMDRQTGGQTDKCGWWQYSFGQKGQGVTVIILVFSFVPKYKTCVRTQMGDLSAGMSWWSKQLQDMFNLRLSETNQPA